MDGEVKATDDNLNGNSQALGDTWYLMAGDATNNYQVDGRISEFLVYTSSASTTATDPTAFVGSAVDNTFTYAGEAGLTRIDGKGGDDVITLSGASTGLNATIVTLNSIALIYMQNGEANQFTISDGGLTANGTILNVLMDSGDRVVYNSKELNYDANQEAIIFGTAGNDTINMFPFNEKVYGRGGSDTFVYNAQSDVRTDSTA